MDDTGVTRRRQREPEDELDADSARHNGFFRGFGAADDEVGHRPPKRRRSRAGMVAMVVIIIFLGGVVGAGAYGYHWYSSRHADWTGSGFGTVIVQVPQGGSAYGLSTVLVKDGVIAAAAPFRSYAEASGKASLLEPGYFRLHKHMSAAAAWNLIIDPKARVQIKVGVPDGMRVSKVIALLAAKTGIPLSQFQAALKDTSALGLPSWAKGNPERLPLARDLQHPAWYLGPRHPPDDGEAVQHRDGQHESGRRGQERQVHRVPGDHRGEPAGSRGPAASTTPRSPGSSTSG